MGCESKKINRAFNILNSGLSTLMSHQLHTQHERTFEQNRFVYPVLSRRAGGLSLGINLNPDKICNFDCIYCQVDRTGQREMPFVEMDRLLTELGQMLEWVESGRVYESGKFRLTPQALRRLNDIAFSGDGEPTTYQNFDSIIGACAELKKSAGADRVKMVLITNASMFHRPHVARGLEILDVNQGEIWAKLDAGTEAYYHQICRTPISWQQILKNITQAARIRPLVIQSLFMRVNGVPPSTEELEAYCRRLQEIVAAGGQLSLIQIYTVARKPAESCVSPLQESEVEAIGDLVRQRTGLQTAVFPGFQ
jgi:wyosine [tRNA(Phe)-imidazoG37] synthetase (radical SAM superfamily)